MKLAQQTDLFPEENDEPPWPAIQCEMAEKYAMPHDYPWIVGFSGDKNSRAIVLNQRSWKRTKSLHNCAYPENVG